MKKWPVQDARTRLGEVVKLSRECPQEITVHGQTVAVVVSKEHYDRLVGTKPPLFEFLRSSPLQGVKLGLKRDRSVV